LKDTRVSRGIPEGVCAMRLEDALLYLVVREEDIRGRDVGVFCRDAIAGGVDVIQMPSVGEGGCRMADEVRAALDACRTDDALLVVSDDAELAASIGADGVHLVSPAAEFGLARAIVGLDRAVGLTARTLAEARLGQEVGADYLVYTDAGAGAFLGLRELAGTPVYAGNIATHDEAAERVEAGLLRICIDSAALGAGDVTERAADYSRALGRCM